MITDVKQQIAELNSFNLDNITDARYREYKSMFSEVYDGVLNLPNVILNNNNNTLFARCRINKGEYFNTIDDIWCPPDEATDIGRLNFKKDPMFYCSTDAATAVLEIRPNKEQLITIHNFTLDIESIKCLSLGVDRYHDESFKHINEDDKLKYDFICDQVRKKVSSDQKGNYTPTMLFSKGYRHENFDAYLYHSVATNLQGLNFAFKPEFVKKYYKFHSARVVQILEPFDNETYKIKCLHEAKSLTNDKIDWTPIFDCSGHTINFTSHK